MAGEEKKKKSVPDEVNGNGYDDTKNTSTGTDDSDYSSVYGTGNVVFPEVAQGNNAYQQWLKNQGLDIQGDYAQNVAKAQQAYAQALAQNRAAYERQLGTYGAKAENLAQSGLSASGYSDYLAGFLVHENDFLCICFLRRNSLHYKAHRKPHKNSMQSICRK